MPSAKFVMNSELVTNIYRIAEAKALEDKLAKEKKALEEYLKKVRHCCTTKEYVIFIFILLRMRWNTSRRWRQKTKR